MCPYHLKKKKSTEYLKLEKLSNQLKLEHKFTLDPKNRKSREITLPLNLRCQPHTTALYIQTTNNLWVWCRRV